MGRRLRRVVFAGLGVTLIGCWTLTTDLDVTGALGDLPDGGRRDGDVPDSGVLEASFVDGSLFNPFRPDAQPDGAPLGLCDGHPITPRICDDFDTGALGSKWSAAIGTAGNGAAVLGTNPVLSAPNAFFARIPAGCPAAYSAQLLDEYDMLPDEVRLEFDLSIAASVGNTGMNLAGIKWNTGAAPGFYRVDLGLRIQRLELYQNPPFSVLQTSDAIFPFDTYRHITMTMKLVAPARVIVAVDGVVEIDRALTPIAASQTLTDLDVGVYTGTPCQGAVEARFDNFIYLFKPR